MYEWSNNIISFRLWEFLAGERNKEVYQSELVLATCVILLGRIFPRGDWKFWGDKKREKYYN